MHLSSHSIALFHSVSIVFCILLTIILHSSYKNIRYAKDAVVALIIGSPPGKIFTRMRNVSTYTKQRF